MYWHEQTRSITREGHVVNMERQEITCIAEGKRLLGSPRPRREGIIKMCLKVYDINLIEII
jgi:hypothetical protein